MRMRMVWNANESRWIMDNEWWMMHAWWASLDLTVNLLNPTPPRHSPSDVWMCHVMLVDMVLRTAMGRCRWGVKDEWWMMMMMIKGCWWWWWWWWWGWGWWWWGWGWWGWWGSQWRKDNRYWYCECWDKFRRNHWKTNIYWKCWLF